MHKARKLDKKKLEAERHAVMTRAAAAAQAALDESSQENLWCRNKISALELQVRLVLRLAQGGWMAGWGAPAPAPTPAPDTRRTNKTLWLAMVGARARTHTHTHTCNRRRPTFSCSR